MQTSAWGMGGGGGGIDAIDDAMLDVSIAIDPLTSIPTPKWATTQRTIPFFGGTSTYLDGAAEQPWRFNFTSILRYLAATKEQPPIGRAQRPQQEPFRLGQMATLTFAPREIGEIKQRDGKPIIRLLGLGMLGPNGPLPIHFTEMVKEQSDGKQDHTLANFLDVFHHRFLTHFYRGWAQSQSAAGLDRKQAETFTPYIARLTGDEMYEVATTLLPQSKATARADQQQASTTPATVLPPHARWAFAAHRVRQARNPDGLTASLSQYFGIGVRLNEYQLHWIPIEPVDTCRLGTPRISSMLGTGAMAGEVVPDRQHKFRLVLGPLSLTEYLRFTPQGCDLPALVECVRAFIGYEYVWEIELVVEREEAAPARLGGDELLGWSSWMGRGVAGGAVVGMIFEPENYVTRRLS